MKNSNSKRWRLFADMQIQGGLMVRLFLYWCIFQFSLVAMIAVFTFISGGAETEFLRPSLITSLMVLPIVMLDLLKFSNRFAGPLVNISRQVERLANGQPIEKISLRNGDFCQRLANNLNAIAEQIEHEQDNLSKTAAADRQPSELECHV